MTEILRAFWKEKRPERIAVLVSGILFAVIFWIYEIPVEIAGYAFLLVILWNVIWFTLVFIRYEKRQRILEENQGKIRTEAGGFPEAESRESEMYQELIRQLYEEKKELPDSVFGLPERREYPMPDAAHVRAAEAYFRYCPEDLKPRLARAILQRAQEFGVDVESPTVLAYADK